MTDQLKLQLIQWIINTDDKELLLSIFKMFELKQSTPPLEGPDDFIARGLGLEDRKMRQSPLSRDSTATEEQDDLDDLQASIDDVFG